MTGKQDDQPSNKPRATPATRRPGLRALARKLGVSHTAVARAMRNDSRLSQALRQRVQAVAREEGYVASDVTQTLLTGWSGMIGVVIPSLTSPFVGALVNSISRQLWEEEMIPLVLCSDLDSDREEVMLHTLARKQVGGVIIMPSREDRREAQMIELLRQHTPIVALDSPMPRIATPLVSSDDVQGVQLIMRHLLSQGHRHIVHLGVSHDNPRVDLRREQTYTQAMCDKDLKPIILSSPSRQLDREELTQMVYQFLRTPRGKKTTAFFAFNDAAAYCIYAAARLAGITPGKDLAIVGYGNDGGKSTRTPRASDLLEPPLTSVDQFPHQMGLAAVEVLQQLIAGKKAPAQTLLKPQLHIRASSDFAIKP